MTSEQMKLAEDGRCIGCGKVNRSARMYCEECRMNPPEDGTAPTEAREALRSEALRSMSEVKCVRCGGWTGNADGRICDVCKREDMQNDPRLCRPVPPEGAPSERTAADAAKAGEGTAAIDGVLGVKPRHEESNGLDGPVESEDEVQTVRRCDRCGVQTIGRYCWPCIRDMKIEAEGVAKHEAQKNVASATPAGSEADAKAGKAEAEVERPSCEWHDGEKLCGKIGEFKSNETNMYFCEEHADLTAGEITHEPAFKCDQCGRTSNIAIKACPFCHGDHEEIISRPEDIRRLLNSAEHKAKLAALKSNMESESKRAVSLDVRQRTPGHPDYVATARDVVEENERKKARGELPKRCFVCGCAEPLNQYDLCDKCMQSRQSPAPYPAARSYCPRCGIIAQKNPGSVLCIHCTGPCCEQCGMDMPPETTSKLCSACVTGIAEKTAVESAPVTEAKCEACTAPVKVGERFCEGCWKEDSEWIRSKLRKERANSPAKPENINPLSWEGRKLALEERRRRADETYNEWIVRKDAMDKKEKELEAKARKLSGIPESAAEKFNRLMENGLCLKCGNKPRNDRTMVCFDCFNSGEPIMIQGPNMLWGPIENKSETTATEDYQRALERCQLRSEFRLGVTSKKCEYDHEPGVRCSREATIRDCAKQKNLCLSHALVISEERSSVHSPVVQNPAFAECAGMTCEMMVITKQKAHVCGKPATHYAVDNGGTICKEHAENYNVQHVHALNRITLDYLMKLRVRSQIEKTEVVENANGDIDDRWPLIMAYLDNGIFSLKRKVPLECAYEGGPGKCGQRSIVHDMIAERDLCFHHAAMVAYEYKRKDASKKEDMEKKENPAFAFTEDELKTFGDNIVSLMTETIIASIKRQLPPKAAEAPVHLTIDAVKDLLCEWEEANPEKDCNYPAQFIDNQGKMFCQKHGQHLLQKFGKNLMKPIVGMKYATLKELRDKHERSERAKPTKLMTSTILHPGEYMSIHITKADGSIEEIGFLRVHPDGRSAAFISKVEGK